MKIRIIALALVFSFLGMASVNAQSYHRHTRTTYTRVVPVRHHYPRYHKRVVYVRPAYYHRPVTYVRPYRHVYYRHRPIHGRPVVRASVHIR